MINADTKNRSKSFDDLQSKNMEDLPSTHDELGVSSKQLQASPANESIASASPWGWTIFLQSIFQIKKDIRRLALFAGTTRAHRKKRNASGFGGFQMVLPTPLVDSGWWSARWREGFHYRTPELLTADKGRWKTPTKQNSRVPGDEIPVSTTTRRSAEPKRVALEKNKTKLRRQKQEIKTLRQPQKWSYK